MSDDEKAKLVGMRNGKTGMMALKVRAEFERLQFAGGPVSIPKPTRADLILSAQQWVTRAREELQETCAYGGISWDSERTAASLSALNHVACILKELSDAKE